MKKYFLLAALLCTLPLFADENRLRNDFQPDGMGGIIDWMPANAKYAVTRLDETGPEGKPVLRFDEKSGPFFSHVGFKLVKEEPYSFSVLVRTKGLGGKTGASISLQDMRRLRSSVKIEVPSDTGGEWRKIEWSGKCPDSMDGLYDWTFSFPGRIEAGSYFDICDPVFIPVSDKAKAGTSKRSTSGKYVGRITPVAPELCRINAADARMDFYYPEPLDKPEEDYFLRATLGGKVAESTFDDRNRSVVSFGKVPEGDLTIKVELVGKKSGRTLRSNEYFGKAIAIPSSPTEGKRLNNFVTELWTKKLHDGTDTFTIDADRFVYVRTDKLHKGVTVSIDGKPVLTDSKEGLPEAMRKLSMGSHTVSVDGAKGAKGTITLRLVKCIGSVPVGRTVKTGKRFADYYFGEDYFKRLNYFDGFNQFILAAALSEDPATSALVGRLKENGVTILNSMGMVWARNPCRYKLNEYIDCVTGFKPFKENLPALFQENKIAGDFRTKYNASEVWWKLNLPGKHLGIYIEDGNHCEFTHPEIDTPELAAYANSGSGDNSICEEAYYASYPDEEKIAQKLDFIRKQAADREAIVPTSMAHTFYVFNGWMRLGSWTRWVYPEMDFKPYYSKILQMMATDPAFANIGGLSFSTPSCDEDLMRFTLDAFRHYCIEGRTDNFSDKFDMPLINRNVRNGDFVDGFDGWDVASAKENGVTLGKIAGLGNGPQRRIADRTPGIVTNKAQGDDFALLQAGGGTVSQKLTGLKKGKLYQLQFCSFDYSQLMSKGKAAHPKSSSIKATLKGKLIEYPEMEQVYGRTTPRSRLVGTVFTHRIVFRAKSDTAVVEFTNLAADAHPWGFNFVGVRPYYAKDEAEFKTLQQLFIESDSVK